MIIKNGRVISKIHRLQSGGEYLLDKLSKFLRDNNDIYLTTKISPEKIKAIYRGKDLIWLATYTVDILSCYGSGQWLDNYNWVEDTWKD